jgi:hypothetical protein
LQVNNHRKVAFENAFVVPGLTVRNTNRAMDLYTGVKGSFTRDVSFNIKVSYTIYEDMYFFVNDNAGNIGNQFGVVYDDIELLNYSGEIGADFSDRFRMLARVNLYKYGLKLQQYAWHKPDMDINFSGRYNLGDKILLNADVFYTGNRYAMPFSTEDDPIELGGIADINLGLEYRYNRILSGFFRLNNLTNAMYYKWNNYPLQGFSVMAGFTYSL